jgi:hypothetical protein
VIVAAEIEDCIMTHLFSSCPHDNMHDPEKWVALTQHLAQACNLELGYERFSDFQLFEQNFNRFDLIYAHPLHASRLAARRNFVPLTKFDATFDEAIIVAAKTANPPQIADFANHPVAYVDGTPSHAAYLIAAHRQQWPGIVVPVVKTNYPDVMMAVVQGEASYGIILKSVWDGLTALKDRVTPFTITKTRELVHVFLVSPQLRDKDATITDALVALDSHEEGQAILRRLGCRRIVPFSDVDLQELRASIAVCRFPE